MQLHRARPLSLIVATRLSGATLAVCTAVLAELRCVPVSFGSYPSSPRPTMDGVTDVLVIGPSLLDRWVSVASLRITSTPSLNG
jgi:hypothetical protein